MTDYKNPGALTLEKKLKIIHLINTIWLTVCSAILLVISLRQAGVKWWVIFSLSGYSLVLAVFFIFVYIFAVFRGLVQRQNIHIEHPLTSSVAYLTFYDFCPLLGTLAGLLSIVSVQTANDIIIPAAMGSLITTFGIWMIIDPVIGLIEMSTPKSAQHRKNRTEQMKLQKIMQQQESKQLLSELFEREEKKKIDRQALLQPYCDRIHELLQNSKLTGLSPENTAEIISIGTYAWQQGGLSCMQQLHEMVIKRLNDNCGKPYIIDDLSIIWDGIGSWRKPGNLKNMRDVPLTT